MLAKAKKIILPIILGFFGIALYFAAVHIYVDHRNLHTIIDMVAAQQKAQNAQAPGSPAAK